MILYICNDYKLDINIKNKKFSKKIKIFKRNIMSLIEKVSEFKVQAFQMEILKKLQIKIY